MAEVCIAIREMIEHSEKQAEGVIWNEVGKYISISVPKEEIIKEGLHKVVTHRISNQNREVSVE